MTNVIEMALSDVVYRDDLYPRIKPDTATIQRYAENLEVLPPIEVNQHGILIDGYHRWTAHRKAEAPCIKAIVTETKTEADSRYRSHLAHINTIARKNAHDFFAECSRIGIDARTVEAKHLLLQQPFLLEAIMLRLLNAEPSKRNTQGIDGYFANGKSVEIKTSGLRRWDNISSVADYLLLLHIEHGAAIHAFFHAREWFTDCFSPNNKSRIDIRKSLPDHYTRWNVYCAIAFSIADIQSIKVE